VKFGVIPTSLIERLALWTGKVPVPVLDALVGPLKARCLMAATTTGVFEAMRDGTHTVRDLASRCQVDATALELLLRSLVVFDYAAQHGDGFALSALARRTVLHDSPQSLVGYIAFNYSQWRFMEGLEVLLRSGRGVDFHRTMESPEEWRAYQRAMLEFARFDAPVLAARVPVPAGARDLLDLGGSHGLMGAAICRRHPPLRSTVLDLPQAIVHARPLAAGERLDDVVTHQVGDLLHSDLGRDRDVVLLSQILHHFTPEVIAAVLRRVHRAARAGGVVAIWEMEAPKSGTPAGSGDVPALYFRLTSTSGAFHGDDYATWLRDAGFEGIRIARPALSPGNVLVTGRAQPEAAVDDHLRL